MGESDWKLISAAAAVALCTLYLSFNRRYKWLYIICKVLPRDLKGIWRFTKVNYKAYKVNKNLETVPKLFTKQACKTPDKVAIYYEDQACTFRELEDFTNKIANYFNQEGYKAGDTIALLLDNRPEYVGIWLGLSKIGVVAALINTNLVSVPLVHSITAAKSIAVIFGSDFEKAIDGVKEKLTGVKFYRYRNSDAESVIETAISLNEKLENVSSDSPVDLISKTNPRDKLIYIFTSGTTGLPKAAIISHARYIFAATALYDTALLNSDDIFYNPLPLYHSSGGMVAIGQCLLYGVPNVIRTKFSASNFWKDCNKYNCTIANYIGEICRYILAAHTDDTKIVHNVKKMAGNGLRRDIWEQFVKRFHVPQIYEFYASTEGNANLINLDNTVGAVGFLPPITTFFYPLTLIKCDEDTKEPVRNAQGLCIECKPGDAGILIGKINHNNTLNEFTGYADKKETSKKIVENVFSKGDMYFNSGDILVRDEFGYFYFKDRTGDTYRWKGENVATGEVETVINEIVGLKDCVVYGVEVPNTEGRCGMIALVDSQKTTNIQELGKGLKGHLPSYAIPLFLRIVDSLPMTGTFKVKKIELQKEGFDMSKIKDPLYFFDLKKCTYVPLGDVYDDIISGKLKL